MPFEFDKFYLLSIIYSHQSDNSKKGSLFCRVLRQLVITFTKTSHHQKAMIKLLLLFLFCGHCKFGLVNTINVTIQCDRCQFWFHVGCANLTSVEFTGVRWFCKVCHVDTSFQQSAQPCMIVLTTTNPTLLLADFV